MVNNGFYAVTDMQAYGVRSTKYEVCGLRGFAASSKKRKKKIRNEEIV